MPAKPIFTPESLKTLIALGEGQFLELKGTWNYDQDPPKPIGRDKLRAVVAEYVAGFANADGGTLVIGVEDDGEATGHGRNSKEIQQLIEVPRNRLQPPLNCDHQLLSYDGHEVLIIEIARAPRAVMVRGDGFPYRSGEQTLAESEERINALKQEYLASGFENRLADATPDDVDTSLLPAAAEDGAWLARRGLVVPRQGTPAVSNAAVLLAGSEPIGRWHPAQTVRIFRVDGTERRHGQDRNVTQIERLELPIAELIPAAYKVLSGQIRRSEKLHDLFFREVPEYPTFAWQEAIVNAIAHRDYADQARGVEVWLFEDRMEVVSPGAPVPPVTVESLRERRGLHASRNPRIARILAELGLMREEGEGVPRMFDEMQRSFLHPPEFSVADNTTYVVLRNTPVFEASDQTWQHLVERLTGDDAFRRVLLLHPEGFTNEQYREVNNVGRDEAYRQIQEMVSDGLVQAADRAGRGAQYRLSPALLDRRVWLSERLPRVEAFFAEHDALTNTAYRELFSVPRHVAQDELSRLTESGILIRQGERRGTKYVPGPGLSRA